MRTTEHENLTMQQQWRSRPADERYRDLTSMYQFLASDTQHCGTAVVDTQQLHLEASTSNGLALVGPSGKPAQLTNWSMNQLASSAKSPASYLRSLPAQLAADCLNHSLAQQPRESHQLFLRRHPANGTPEHLELRAITSPGYARIHSAAIVRKLMELQQRSPEWKAPLVYDQGDFSGGRQPCVGFAGDRDAYAMLVNDTVRIADPTSPDGLQRGIMLVNSEVGAKRFDLVCFLCRYVCGNYIVWGYKQIAAISMRHFGEKIKRSWATGVADAFTGYAQLSAREEESKIQAATIKELGPAKNDVIDLLFKKQITTRQQAEDAYQLAERYERNPRSAWGLANGLTRLSQVSAYADERIDLDRAAARVLDF